MRRINNYLLARFRANTQHFNPEKYFKMRNKVISSGGGYTLQAFSALQNKAQRGF